MGNSHGHHHRSNGDKDADESEGSPHSIGLHLSDKTSRVRPLSMESGTPKKTERHVSELSTTSSNDTHNSGSRIRRSHSVDSALTDRSSTPLSDSSAFSSFASESDTDDQWYENMVKRASAPAAFQPRHSIATVGRRPSMRSNFGGHRDFIAQEDSVVEAKLKANRKLKTYELRLSQKLVDEKDDETRAVYIELMGLCHRFHKVEPVNLSLLRKVTAELIDVGKRRLLAEQGGAAVDQFLFIVGGFSRLLAETLARRSSSDDSPTSVRADPVLQKIAREVEQSGDWLAQIDENASESQRVEEGNDEEDSVDNESLVQCHLCESSVPQSKLAQHTKVCSQTKEDELKLGEANQDLSALMEQIRRSTNGPEAEMLQGLPVFQKLVGLRDLADRAREATDLSVIRAVERDLSKLRGPSNSLPTIMEMGVIEMSSALERCCASKASVLRSTEKVTRHRRTKKRDEGVVVNKTHGAHASIKDFRPIRVLGKGGFGKVILVQKKQTGDVFAVKRINKHMAKKTPQDLQRVLTERLILSNMESPYVVRLYYAFQTRNHMFMVMEFVGGGDVLQIMETRGRIEENVARRWIAQCVLALEYLHSRGVVHRDVKPENMLLTEPNDNGDVKLTDFGLSAFLKQSAGAPTEKEMNQTRCGTPDYVCPEILLGTGHNHMADWWSLGASIYDMLVGIPPFAADSKREIWSNIIRGRIYWGPEELATLSNEAVHLITGLLDGDSTNRLGANGVDEIKQHPFFRGLDWTALAHPPTLPAALAEKKRIRPTRKALVSLEELGEFRYSHDANDPNYCPADGNCESCQAVCDERVRDFSFTSVRSLSTLNDAESRVFGEVSVNVGEQAKPRHYQRGKA